LDVDGSGRILQLILNNVGIITDIIVSEREIRHGKKHKNGLRVNGKFSFMESGDWFIVQSDLLKMSKNN
jgi:hypothetical protein